MAKKKKRKPVQKNKTDFFKNHKSIFIIMGIVFLLLLGLLFGYQYILTNYTVTTSYVEGNVHYTDEEILDLLVNRKWYATIFEGIKALYVTTSHQMTNRIVELVERYEDTLPELTAAVADYESKVKAHLKRMGFVW